MVVAAIGSAVFLAAAASAQPVVKVVNFTADWCPNCAVLNPMLDEAIDRFDAGQIEQVDLDLTDIAEADDETRQRVFLDAIALAQEHQAGYLWEWYPGVTGLAAIISADNGEPISCVNRALTTDEIAARLEEALVLALRAPAGRRKPAGPDCPPPIDPTQQALPLDG